MRRMGQCNCELSFQGTNTCGRVICQLEKPDTCKPYFKDLKLIIVPLLCIYDMPCTLSTCDPKEKCYDRFRFKICTHKRACCRVQPVRVISIHD